MFSTKINETVVSISNAFVEIWKTCIFAWFTHGVTMFKEGEGAKVVTNFFSPIAHIVWLVKQPGFS